MVVKKSVFKFLCLTLAVGMALTSCKKDDDGDKPDNTPEADTTQHNNTPEEVVVEDKGVSLHSSELYEYMKTQTDELQTYDVKIVDATPNFDEIVKALCENNKIHVSLDFGQCTGMKEFPDGAFTHRYSTDLMNLVSVTIPNSVTKIGASAFSKCVGLTSIVIPDGVTEIGARAFWKCTCLMTVKLPASLKTIGKEAFYNCITLSEINLPDNVADIEENAFSGCSFLKSITIPAGVSSIKTGTFENCQKLANVSLPEGLTTIDYCAFKGCSNLRIDFPSSLTNIEQEAFANCLCLNKLTIPSKTKLGVQSFEGCTGLQEVYVEEGVTLISMYCFKDCINLKTVILPNSIVTISGGAFNRCRNMNLKLNCAMPPSVGSMAIPLDASIYVADELLDTYKENDKWSYYSKIIKPMSEFPETTK
ncbi:MAG: leucine-rich repeat protein [Bacteroidales bacterium]|nr:leucine-rich repeat protein [Bacteroidales bacterium]